MANNILNNAKSAKKDEFYTQIADIENELRHYKDHFKGKVVLCNCDDPRVSNFFKYFALKFKDLGLKKLICTCYKNQDIDLFSEHKSEQAVYIIYEGTPEIDHIPSENEIEVKFLKGDGDFRSPECIELLEQADIVCTNPPFSLLREYINILVKYKKSFLIIGNENSLHYSDVFPLIKNNEIWLGYNHVKEFIQPDGSIKKFGNICWLTNLDTSKRHEELVLIKRYNPEDYPKYYNFDAINVDTIGDIPFDYPGMMGVPDSLLNQFNPDQFELIGLGRDGEGITVDRSIYPKIKKLNPNSRPSHIGYFTKDGTPKEPYSRIIVRLKNPQK